MSSLPGPEENDSYLSVENGPEIEIKVKGSSFLGRTFRVTSLEEVDEELQPIRKQYYDATHHCRAYRIGPPETMRDRAEDDGEPSGTAGLPILGAIQRENLYDVLVVVTRYFGGTKLGTGGLVRAYGDCARTAVEAAPRKTIWHERKVRAVSSYNDVGAVEAVLAREGAQLRGVERRFESDAAFEVTVLRSQVQPLIEILSEATGGRVRGRVHGESADDSVQPPPSS